MYQCYFKIDSSSDVFWKLFYHRTDFKTPKDDGKIVLLPKMTGIPCFMNTESIYLVFTYIIKSTAHWIPNQNRKSCLSCGGSLLYLDDGVDFEPESKPWDIEIQGLSRVEVS